MRGNSRGIPIGLSILLGGALASAEEPGQDAESLFREGRELLERGDNSAACAKLEASYRLEPTSGVMLGLAICQEALGRLATAWRNYEIVLERARLEGRADREHAARSALIALEPRLSRLDLRMPDVDHADWVVKLDGAQISPNALMRTLPIDPGVHTVEVSGSRIETWHTTVTAAAEGETLTITVAPRQPAAKHRDLGSASVNLQIPRYLSVHALGPPMLASPPKKDDATRVPFWTWTTYGVGAVATGSSILLGGLALDRKNELGCADNRCPVSLQSQVDAYNGLRTAHFITLTVGVAALATGAVLTLFGSRASKPLNTALMGMARF